MASLVIQKDSGDSFAFDLNAGTYSIGRHPENSIVLGDASVSSHHAEIMADDGSYLLRDLQSSNGTKVNGARITEATIKSGDAIFFGGVECRFQDAPAAPEAESEEPRPTPEKQQPQPLPPPFTPANTAGREDPQPRKISGAARSSLVCGILSLVFVPLGILALIFTIPALICGHSARRKIRNANGTLAGGGRALAGLIMGYASIVLVALVIQRTFQLILHAREVQSSMNERAILIACNAYAFDHENAFPPNLDALVPRYLPNRTSFASTLSPHESFAYYYYGGTLKDPPNKVVVMSKFKDKEGKRIIGHANGSAALEIPPPDLGPPNGQ